MSSELTRSFFRALLQFNWLRPELSLVHAFQLAAVYPLFPQPLPQPSVEFGCTDGVCTFVLLGGQADVSYDDYLDIPEPSRNSDVVDYFEVSIPMDIDVVSLPASETFTYGVSWKDAHLERARRLGVYQNLIRRNLGDHLPLDDESANFIWAPNLFQVQPHKLDTTVRDLSRILTSRGTIVTIAPDLSQKQYEFFQQHPQIPSKLERVLDRGIARNLTMNAKSHDEWASFFEERGLRIQGHIPFWPRLVGDIYQVGLRPMFPALMKAYAILRSSDLDEFIRIKRLWIETEDAFLGPLCDPNTESGTLGTHLWHAYQLVHDE